MNARVFAAVVVAALLLSVIELSCVADDYPSALGPTVPGLYTDVPEPELPAVTDQALSAHPVLTR